MTTEPLAGTEAADAAFGRLVHHAMWDRRLTQRQLAAQLGINQSAVSKKLRGERPWYLAEIVQVARLLHLDVGLLAAAVDEPGPGDPPASVAGAKIDPTFPCLSDTLSDQTARANVLTGPWGTTAASAPAA